MKKDFPELLAMAFGGMIILIGVALSQSLPGDLIFKNYTIEDGLPGNEVYNILQDESGFLWLGTSGGLARFDGYGFKVFQQSPDNPEGLSDNLVITLCKGNYRGEPVLWIGTESGGLNAFFPKTETFLNWQHDPDNPKSLSSNWVFSVMQHPQDSSGVVWVGTRGSGLAAFHPETGQFESWQKRVPEGHTADIILRMAPCRQKPGRIWVTTMNGLFRAEPGSEQLIPVDIFPQSKKTEVPRRIEAIAQLASGDLWLGTFTSELIRLAPQKNRSAFWDEDPGASRPDKKFVILDILPADDGTVWIATLNQGLKHFDPRTGVFRTFVHHADNPGSLGANSTKWLFLDKTRQLWIGTGSGLSKADLRPQPFRIRAHEKDQPGSLDASYTWSVLEDRQSTLWVGTSAGLNRLNPDGSFTSFPAPFSRENPSGFLAFAILHIAEDRHGDLWLGTFGQGLLKFDREREKFRHFLLSALEPGNREVNMVYQIAEDPHSGELWVGTEGGLRRFAPDSGTLRKAPSGRQDFSPRLESHINAVHISPDSTLWIGTLSEGLYQWRGADSTYRHWGSQSGELEAFSSNAILDIATLPADSGKVIWLATGEEGVYRLDLQHNHLDRFNSLQGLPNNQALTIQVDLKGSIWITTKVNISRLDPQTGNLARFEASAQGKTFNFNPFGKNMRRSGELFYGGSNGLLSFFPAQLEAREKPPVLALTELRLFNRPVHIGERGILQANINQTPKIVLSHTADLFSVEFAILDYLAPERHAFSYRLEGFHDEWVHLGTRRFIEFSNLDPGSYTLHLRGSNSLGVWNEGERTLAIEITPPWWATWWFRLLSLALVSTLIYALYRYRVNQLLGIERTRTRIARDLHDEVSANLSSISFFSEAVHRSVQDGDPANTHKYLDLIEASAGEARGAMDDIIWAINPQHDDLSGFLSRLRRFAADLFASRDIHFDFDSPPEERLRGKLSLEAQRDIWLIFKEIITNIVKHADCRQVSINIELNHHQMEMRIADDGKGFDPGQPGNRNGLQNIRARAAEMQATCQLTSEAGQGTKWELRFRI
ncbi:MAG: ATP-binding protein [Calditrichaeota bacterium]|nr:ATP-binding protein [Calditrichota bacterium]